ncbi:MAG: sigma-70 family RNA polymerase sigma factor [Candidatus Marinimicrobia bacterium]|nr:sigma-70 family RNA polymerase sigma factor [Candidatus Neomarinimicrobiota bacterium]
MKDKEVLRQEFNRVILENYKMIYHLFFRMLKDHDEAKDLTQDTFFKAYKKYNSFRHESSVSTWLYRIAVNTGINYLKRKKYIAERTKGEATMVNAGTDPDVSVEFDYSALTNAISKLSPRQQSVVILRVYQNLPFRQIANIVGGTENAAKVNFSHAIKNLRSILKGVKK